MNPPFAGTKRGFQSGPRPIRREGCAYSGGVVLIEVFALKLDNMSGQQFSIRSGHPDEAAMEAIRIERVGDGIYTHHFEVGLKEYLAGKKQGTGENGVHLEDLVQRDADPAGTQIHCSLDELFVGPIRLRLKTDGERDSDAIIFTAIAR
jgi:hypothetical protein